MQLMLFNIQSGLRPIERGKHAKLATTKYGANGGTSVAKYAERLTRKEQSVRDEVHAFEVYEKSTDVRGLEKYFHHLVAIHAAPHEMWAELTQQMMERKWTVTETEAAVKARDQNRHKKTQTLAGPRYILLEQWKQWTPEQRSVVTQWPHSGRGQHFNWQDSDSIEWAKWSWNPVTGCLHNCPYCYARDFAERIYAQKFEPTLWPERLGMPYDTPVPDGALTDISLKNVFTCSMADLFGQWVPREWIELVLYIVRENPQWNFLFLTKFPNRMAEFEYPDNAWLGTTVDLQARVQNAERAMRKVKASVKWLSIEPLIEPLRFEDLSAFKWIVIGGASRSSETPEWRPPRHWVWDLSVRANDAGCLVYHKTNLNHDRLKQFPANPNAETEPEAAPPVFHYLKVIP